MLATQASNAGRARRTAALGPVSLKKYGEPVASTTAPTRAQSGCETGAVPVIIPPLTYAPSTWTSWILRPWTTDSERVSFSVVVNWPTQRSMLAAGVPPALAMKASSPSESAWLAATS